MGLPVTDRTAGIAGELESFVDGWPRSINTATSSLAVSSVLRSSTICSLNRNGRSRPEATFSTPR